MSGYLDMCFGFEHHSIQGLKKMKLHLETALIPELEIVIARIKEKTKGEDAKPYSGSLN